MGKTIDIKLSSRYDGKGVESAKRQLNDFANAFSKIGEAVGGSHSNLAKFVKEFMVGGVWGAAADEVMKAGR